MPKKDIVVIGASAGGVHALKSFIAALPQSFTGTIFVVLHLAPYSPSHLPEILSKAGRLPAVHPHDGDIIKAATIYVAPPDHHLLIEKNTVLIKKGPKENRFRPSIDALFRSAAYEYGTRVTGIILSGVLDDGTAGMWSVQRMGGTCMVQEPEDAEHDAMPMNVLEYVNVDHVLPATEMGNRLMDLIARKHRKVPAMTAKEKKLLQTEIFISMEHDAFKMGILKMGELSLLTCPECYGALVKLDGKIVRYRCHTGHAYTASTLLSAVTETVESGLWQAVRALEESVMILNNMAAHFTALKHKDVAALFSKRALENAARTKTLHESIFQQQQLSGDLQVNDKQAKPAKPSKPSKPAKPSKDLTSNP